MHLKIIRAVSFATLLFVLPIQKVPATVVASKEIYVYICDSKTAYVYHSTKDCAGLNACTHEIKKVTLDDAINKYERRACKKCE